MLSSAVQCVEFLLLRIVSKSNAVAVWLEELSCATATMSLKKAIADPTWIQSPKETIMVSTIH